MPSRRHNAAIDSSPRRPSSTMRIFSSAPYCLRVARRMSFATCSAEAFCVPAFCLIFAPLKGYDEPEILPSQLSRFCLIGADAGQLSPYLANSACSFREGLRIPEHFFNHCKTVASYVVVDGVRYLPLGNA